MSQVQLLRNAKHGLCFFLPRAALPYCLLLFSGPLLAQGAETVSEVVAEQESNEAYAKQSQARIDSLDEETSRMLAEYRQVTAEAESLKIYNQQLARQVESQEQEKIDILRQMQEIETTAREVVPMMQRMLNTLDRFVGFDLPFLEEERSKRLNNLDEIMARADVTVSEKYRRILEAYGVEMEYGRTIEAYRAELQRGDQTLMVDFLRIGRIALMFQSLDGELTGYWDAVKSRWVTNSDYKDAVRKGIRVAKQQAAPDLMTLPVSAPEDSSL